MVSANCFADPKLGSISSLRCQKSRTRVCEDNACEVMFRGRRSRIKCLGNQTIWWSQTGSNRRPHACKARALPAELWPRTRRRMLTSVVETSLYREKTHPIKVVGLGRLELPTSRLSSARSNQLSYKPLTTRGMLAAPANTGNQHKR